MITTRDITHEMLEALAAERGLDLPIEQTAAWANYQARIEGRTPWGGIAVERDGAFVALASFIDFSTHGYHYLRSWHGPVWASQPDAQLEEEVLAAIRDHVRHRDARVLFLRLGVAAPIGISRPTLSGIPYDTTVVMDLEGGDEAILGRMKARGRRDVRKALRESPATYADETALAAADFDEYYDVMRETAERDGFVPAPASDYQGMLQVLGAGRCRLFAGRVDGRVVSWTIATVSDSHAVRYYGASRSDVPKRSFVTDGLIYFEACTLGAEGVRTYDMMGMGSDAFPGLSSLNTFKAKFAEQSLQVAPDRDVPVRGAAYAALVEAKHLRDGAREARQAAAERREAARDAKSAPARADIVPVVLGGDIGAYALCREFHEAYGVRCNAVASAPIAAISRSSFIDVVPVTKLVDNEIARAVGEVAAAHADAHVVVIGNTDALIRMLGNVAPGFPANVACPIPSPEVVARVSDKVEFANLCREHGLDVPQTEVVSLAGDGQIPPTQIAFPLVAKPARSSEYADFLASGFDKVYYVQEQAQLDDLWASLREAGFAGDFLVQELIGGDDTYMDSLTLYLDAEGNARLYGAAQVLLEDHSPSMLGNPVAMVTRPKPELWEKAARMLVSVGYRGFANFDIKRDPKTGRTLFLEVNPRIGRNSYYNCAAGVNPMQVMVEDAVLGLPASLRVASEKILYTVVPVRLALRYVRDPELKAEVAGLAREGRVFDPQRYAADAGLARTLAVDATELNQYRKFARHYPKPTDTSF